MSRNIEEIRMTLNYSFECPGDWLIVKEELHEWSLASGISTMYSLRVWKFYHKNPLENAFFTTVGLQQDGMPIDIPVGLSGRVGFTLKCPLRKMVEYSESKGKG